METRTLNERVAAEVRASIARKGISQSIVADGAAMSNASLSRKLRGQYPFAVDELLAIAPLLDTTASAILAAAEATDPAVAV
jgi:transcriptional regulator with XRE-family HTH domain